MIFIDMYDLAIEYSTKRIFPDNAFSPTLDVSVTHVVLSFDYINSGKNIHIQVKE